VAIGSCLIQLVASATIVPAGMPPVASLGVAGMSGAIGAIVRRELLRRPPVGDPTVAVTAATC
jgi:hypothetical protein